MENSKTPRKIGWRLNLFDIIIIIFVIVMAAAVLLIWRSYGNKAAGDATAATTVHYTIELTNMTGNSAGIISVGDTITDGAKKYEMGTVVSVELAPMTTSAQNLETGDTVLSEVPDRQTAIVILETDCIESQSQILATSGYLIRAGEEVQAMGPGYAGLGHIIAIERDGDVK